ncbi:drug/metabolite transporter (DMT)-like permease [Pseudochrobactrum saccharolyticum]|uniref:Drug/metabolite transporter (DMT)-like permease n=1 Tax=Pseudochrobactrum saccharolyticum TaxID=354352 RepID=A0A7W8ENE0_9HYPH|nr:drug/metabolite transporter (DMT)-like permease [Pseudochrobactrum saccharolyticum]UCA46463.1 DMT family transporter [Pseudochrobactrum sp. XF203]
MNAPERHLPLADTPAAADEPRPLLGIACKVTSVFIFVLMSTLLKSAEGIPAGELVFFRSFFAIFPVVIYLAYTHQLQGAMQTSDIFGHIWRGLVGVMSMLSGFYALTLLPLPESIAINYASPLMIVVLSAIFLKEQVRIYRWSAVLIGFVGVLIIVWPRLSLFSGGGVSHGEAVGAVFALIGALSSAVAMMLVRKLVKRERTATIVIYFSITSTVIALFTMPFGWVVPQWWQLALLIAAGFAGGIAQIFLTECYRHADMSTIAPFEYTSMLLGLGIGYVVFGDVPTLPMLIGSTIVIGAGIFIIFREHKLSGRKLRRN